MHSPFRPLRIVHVFRAPVGGLFRHVLDAANGQAARGHQVGLIADSNTGGERAEKVLQELAPRLALGLARLPMNRQISPADFGALRQVEAHLAKMEPDVVHGHGAKGGAFARLARTAPQAIRAYTPHGGSLIYKPGALSGWFYRGLERLLLPRTDLFLFESGFVRDVYTKLIGRPGGVVKVVCNGVGEPEFAPIERAADATDLVFIGELRPVKGIDILFEALANLRRLGRPTSVTLVGDGPDRQSLQAQAARLGIADMINFTGPMPARQAFARGKLMVVPSRAESLPYVVLEAAAAAMPIVATNVGGVPEIFGADAGRLIPPQDVPALTDALHAALSDCTATRELARRIQQRVRQTFSLDAMVDGGIAAYREALAPRSAADLRQMAGAYPANTLF